MPAIHSKQPLLKPTAIAVTTEGELVRVSIGNADLRMHYEDALKIAQWIRVQAKAAKKACGDVSRHWSVVGTLDGLAE